jgi:hypothetical protein
MKTIRMQVFATREPGTITGTAKRAKSGPRRPETSTPTSSLLLSTTSSDRHRRWGDVWTPATQNTNNTPQGCWPSRRISSELARTGCPTRGRFTEPALSGAEGWAAMPMGSRDFADMELFFSLQSSASN